jgi:DNA polymerase elongation subunit (family B)
MNTEEIIFHSTEWSSYNKDDDDEDDNIEDDNANNNIITNGSYKIKIYGRTESGESITVEVDKFYPYFYVKIPENWTLANAVVLINYFKLKINSKSAIKGLKSFEIVEKKDSYGFNADKIFKFLKLVFKDTVSYRAFENHIEYNKINCRSLFSNPVKLRLYESNLESLLRFLHVTNLQSCGWIKLIKPKKTEKSSYCKNDYKVTLKNILPCDNNKLGKIIIVSFDIECRPGDGISFPDANKENDCVTQIGSVFSYSGDPEPFYVHIITLKKANNINGMENVIIESYNSEVSVLLAWTKLMQKMDPDVVTGYNINGFDFDFLYKRSKKLGISVQFSKLGKNLNESCKFEEKVLASSALGENILKYYNMTGRVIIDLMKVIQRDHKLNAYSLDFVSSHFIRKEILMCDRHEKYFKFYTDDVYGIKEDDFISIVYVFGFDDTKHGQKFQINKITKLSDEEIKSKYNKINKIKNYEKYVFNVPKKLYEVKIIGNIPDQIFMDNNSNLWHHCELPSCIRFILAKSIKEIVEIEDLKDNKKPMIEQKIKNITEEVKGNKVFWTLAKDDLSPNKMFQYQEGTDDQRGIIAKYCIKDCILVTQILEKLKIVGNNIGMANVCNVPLTYIFFRGQSIKIFSLVAKKCLEYEYLLPKIKKPYRKEGDPPDEEKEVGYEGATVLPPKIGVHYEAIIVLDFASLYPSSMICKNICVSKILLDNKYDNLPNYNYNNVVFNNADGTTCTCRFAEDKSGEKGIYPKILKELLTERKNKKNLMESSTEQFLKDIYNALQQAYKQTANSLYGQLGASVSPIYMKELAASTTAVGRNMLNFAKLFMENNLKKLVNYSLHDKEKYLTYCEELFKNANEKKFTIKKAKTTNKGEFIEFFYNRCNELLSSEYSIKPTIIYGDSVTSNTPILLLNNSGDIEIKEIQYISNEWTSYNAFKSDIAGLTNKEQNNVKCNYKVWTDKGWGKIKRVIRHKTNKKIFEIITTHGYVTVTQDHSLLDENGNQIKPENCKIGTKLLHNNNFDTFRNIHINNITSSPKEFIDKYIKENEFRIIRKNNDLIFIFNNNEIENAMIMYYSCKSLGYYVSIDIKDNCDKIIHIKSSKDKPENYDNFDRVLRINDLNYISDYVYDLETDVGHFHAGVGSMIVKNTDSVFFTAKIHKLSDKIVLTNTQALRVSIELGILAGYAICAILPEPEELVYEKTLWPLILRKKKKYVGHLYEEDYTIYKLKCMGIELVRRDIAPIAKIITGSIVNNILYSNGNMTISQKNQQAIDYTKTLIKKVLRGEFPIEKFIMSKALKSTYVNRGSQPHIMLADRMRERDPGSAPNINDRVQFVFIIKKQTGKKKKKLLQGEKTESPQYVIDNNLKIDLLHYITNQIMKPCLSYLELIAKNPEKIFNDYINKELNRRGNKKSIMDYVGNDNDNDNNSDNQESDSDNEEIEEEDSNNSRIVKNLKEKQKKSFVFEI